MKKTFIALTLSVTFLVTGCGEDKMKDEAVEFTKEAILKKLADPESASFSDIKFVNTNFDTGIIDRRYYDYEIACSKGVEAFNKNREEKSSSK